MSVSAVKENGESPLVNGTGPASHVDGIPATEILNNVPGAQAKLTTNLTLLPSSYYRPFLSDASKARLPSPIRQLIPLHYRPGMLSLFAGSPSPETFPFESMSLTVRSVVNPSEKTTIDISGKAMEDALQYGPTPGYPDFVKWMSGLQERSHSRKQGEGWRVSIGVGSQDLLYKAFHALINPGDHVLVEAPVYTGVIPIFKDCKATMIEIETDPDGILADSLEHVLRQWPAEKPKPKFLYTVPYGCNPTGATANLQRRLKVLQLAREFDFLILEDDPYYYLYYGDAPRPPSYFQLEAEDEKTVGHVLRFDSFSKILAAGLRLGSVSGPEALVDAIDLHTSSANLQSSSTSQVIAYTLLQTWGYDGFRKHCEDISLIYRKRRDIFEAAMKRHMSGLAEWKSPVAGMFVWFKLPLRPTEDAPEGDSETLIATKAVEKNVLALPGTSFFANGRKTAFVRVSFSMLGEDDTNEALRRLALVVREAQLL